MNDADIKRMQRRIEQLEYWVTSLNSELLKERMSNIGKVHPCDDQTAANLASALASLDAAYEELNKQWGGDIGVVFDRDVFDAVKRWWGKRK